MIRIAAVQMRVGNDICANEARILKAVEAAAKARADILLSPEGSLSGYTSRFNQASLALSLGRVLSKAKTSGVGLALGTCFKEADSKRYNQVRVYSKDGTFKGFHSKILRCSRLDAPGTGELAEYATTPLTTFKLKGRIFGCLICNDLWASPGFTVTPNPYLAWELKKLGVSFILHSVNSGSGQEYRAYHESNHAAWAMTLKIPIVTVNALPRKGKVNASSGVMGPGGRWLFKAKDKGERFFTFDLEV